jgi:DNA-binding HxlR family transcriptional regulator
VELQAQVVIDGKEYIVKIDGRTYHCAVDIALGYVGGKWKTVVLYYLMEGTKRYSELRRLIPDISEKMLAKALRELHNDGFVRRKSLRQIPPRVEYSLTKEGRTLAPLLGALADWGKGKTARSGGKMLVMENAPAYPPLGTQKSG